MKTTPKTGGDATKAGGDVLPVVAWKDAWGGGGRWGQSVALTPHAPAQATIDELRAEVERLTKENVALKDGQQIDARNYLECDAERERLTRERDELNDARNAAIERSNFMFAATRDAQNVASLANDRWAALQRRFSALEAKQIDVEAVMRLADMYADAARWNLVTGEKPVDAAREALRASLLGDGGTL